MGNLLKWATLPKPVYLLKVCTEKWARCAYSLNFCASETSFLWKILILRALNSKALAVLRAVMATGTFLPFYIDMH